jgi:hypothetical protein
VAAVLRQTSLALPYRRFLVAETFLMSGQRLNAALSVVLAFVLAGCSVPVGIYHSIEGGAIAQKRQAPPDADLPYPNLANVPPAPPPYSPYTQALIDARVHNTTPGVSPPSPGALAGLELPTAPPPAPNVPGYKLPAAPAAPAPAPKPAPPPLPPNGPPVSLAFQPGSAILPFSEAASLRSFAATRGSAKLLAGGFGDGTSLTLALARAQRLADALTASGVPPQDIRLTAMAAGSGGFVQLVY